MRFTNFLVLVLFTFSLQATDLKHDPEKKTILITDGSELLQIQINYSKGCRLSQVKINGQNTISPSGVFTSIKTGTGIHLP